MWLRLWVLRVVQVPGWGSWTRGSEEGVCRDCLCAPCHELDLSAAHERLYGPMNLVQGFPTRSALRPLDLVACNGRSGAAPPL